MSKRQRKPKNTDKPKKRRKKKNTTTFTDTGLKKLKPPEKGQELYWDKAQRGLSLLVSPGGTKTFRSTYKLHGDWLCRSIGRFGEMVPNADPDKENVNIGEARNIVANDRALAVKGIDPKEQGKQPASKDSFESVVDEFITHYAKPRQRTWDQTERVLKNNCAAWLKRPINDIGKQDARKLLRGFIADGHGPKAAVTRAWLKKLWRWAYGEDLVTAPIMEAISIEFERNERDRVFSDSEIKAIWSAADKCAPFERDYVKLLGLLAARKTELACMSRSDLDDPTNPTVWTVPFELTKSRKTSNKKRTYLVPLPPLAQRIVKGLLTRHKEDRLFHGLPVSMSKAGRLQFNDGRLKKKLKQNGAPKDYYPHAWRHTIATFLQNAGYSEWERGLALNHSGTTVTAGYSHGYPLELKRKLLEQWATHIEQLIEPAKGVPKLRG